MADHQELITGQQTVKHGGKREIQGIRQQSYCVPMSRSDTQCKNYCCHKNTATFNNTERKERKKGMKHYTPPLASVNRP